MISNDSCVHNGDDDIAITRHGVPGRGYVDRIVMLEIVKVWIVRCCGGVEEVVWLSKHDPWFTTKFFD